MQSLVAPPADSGPQDPEKSAANDQGKFQVGYPNVQHVDSTTFRIRYQKSESQRSLKYVKSLMMIWRVWMKISSSSWQTDFKITR